MNHGDASVLPREQVLAFGPVSSRRLGLSLGVNIVPRKACTYDCVYCQLGSTTNLTSTRKEYIQTSVVVDAVLEKLDQSATPDYVTFVGDGEPTLALNLANAIDRLSEQWQGRIALITNGSLLWMHEVREAADRCDVVLPTLSAGSRDVFRALHRPHGQLSFDRCVEGMHDLVARNTCPVWAEVMLVAGINDHPESLREIGDAVRAVGPAETHLTAPLRPPSVSTVQPPSRDTIELALSLIPDAIDFTYPESSAMPSTEEDSLRHLVDIAGTHPLRHDQAISVLVGAGYGKDAACVLMDKLVDSGALLRLDRHGTIFYVRGREGPRAIQHL